MPWGGSAAEGSAPPVPSETEVATRIYRLFFGCFRYQHYCAETTDDALNVSRNNEKIKLLYNLFISFTASEEEPSQFEVQWKNFEVFVGQKKKMSTVDGETSQVEKLLRIIPKGLKPLLAIVFRYSPIHPLTEVAPTTGLYEPESPKSDLQLRVRISVEHMLLKFLALLLHATVLFNDQRPDPEKANTIALELPLYHIQEPGGAFRRTYSFLDWYTEKRHEQKIFAELYEVSENKETILSHLTDFYAALTEPITDELIDDYYPKVFEPTDDLLQWRFKRWALEYFVAPQLTEFYERKEEGGLAAMPVAFVFAAMKIAYHLPSADRYTYRLEFFDNYSQHYKHDGISGTKLVYPLAKSSGYCHHHERNKKNPLTKRNFERINLRNISYRFPRVVTERLDAIAGYERGGKDSDVSRDEVERMHDGRKVQSARRSQGTKRIPTSDDESEDKTLRQEQTRRSFLKKTEIEKQLREQSEQHKREKEELLERWYKANSDYSKSKRQKRDTKSSFIDKTLCCKLF